MKHYVITIKDHTMSEESANRLIESGKRFGMEIEKFYGFTPKSNPRAVAESQNIPIEGFREVYSRFDNCLAAFLSHFGLWKLSVELDEEITIFEHDAYIVAPIPDHINHLGCISLGKPSYGKYQTPPLLGVNSLESKRYFPGAHAYRIKPDAAEKLIEQSKINAGPTYVFLHKDRFSFLQEYYPWPVEARDYFTTIQKENGCKAKHNYGPGYHIV